MSTRSYIIARVPKHMIGTTIQFDAKKLPVKVGEKDYSKPRPYPVIEREAAPREPIKLEHEYIGIYHHHDGYVEGLGATLLKDYTTLDAVLNLIAGGDCSSCLEHYMGWAEYGNNTADMLPVQSDEPMPDEEYSYLFDNGKWVYYSMEYDRMKRPHDLKAAVKRIEKKRK